METNDKKMTRIHNNDKTTRGQQDNDKMITNGI